MGYCLPRIRAPGRWRCGTISLIGWGGSLSITLIGVIGINQCIWLDNFLKIKIFIHLRYINKWLILIILFVMHFYLKKLPLFATGIIFEGKTCWLESFWPTWLAVVKGTTFCAMMAEPSGKVHRSCLFCVWQSSDPSFSTTSRWLFFNIGWDWVSLQVTGILNPTINSILMFKGFFSECI